MSFAARASSFIERSKWLGALQSGTGEAAFYIIKSKFSPSLRGQASYKNQPITFRKQDMSALKEVLVDQEYSFLKELAANIDRPKILDLGAHIGTFSLWLQGENAGANILSLEADPETYEVLQTNIKGSQNQNWRALNGAAWKNEEELSFSNQGDAMSHRLSDKGEIKVRGMPFNLILQEADFDDIDLMKLDIEGAEEAFLSSEPALLKKVKNLVIEIHPNLCSEENVRSLLNENFSKVEEIEGRASSKPLLFCQQTP